MDTLPAQDSPKMTRTTIPATCTIFPEVMMRIPFGICSADETTHMRILTRPDSDKTLTFEIGDTMSITRMIVHTLRDGDGNLGFETGDKSMIMRMAAATLPGTETKHMRARTRPGSEKSLVLGIEETATCQGAADRTHRTATDTDTMMMTETGIRATAKTWLPLPAAAAALQP